MWRTALARSNAYDLPTDGRIDQDYFDKNIPLIERRLLDHPRRRAQLGYRELESRSRATCPGDAKRDVRLG